jgi:geranylgeranyl reductase family protein
MSLSELSRVAFDVAIIGAGPAGASAAVAAARAGARVVLFEAERFPRDKPCGDALTPFAVEQLRKLHLLNALTGGHVVTRVALRGHHRDILDMRWPSGGRTERRTGVVIPRHVLDHNLARAAADLGVTVRTGTRVVSLAADESRHRVKVSYQDSIADEFRGLEARIAVLAAGARSNRLSPSANAMHTHLALRGEVRLTIVDKRTLQFFTPRAMNLPSFPGYGWIFPMTDDGLVNAGIGAFVYDQRRRRNINLRRSIASFQDWLAEFGDVRCLVDELDLCGWTIPTNLRPPPDQPRILLAGDAAGLAHPLTGEGIGPALRSGRIAATVCVEFLDHSDPIRASRQYRQRVWGSRLGGMTALRASAPFQWRLAEKLSSGDS